MRRTLWMVVSLAVIVLWLVLSYTPSIVLPRVSYPAWSGPLLGLLAALGLAAFLALQVWIVRATDRSLISDPGAVAAAEFGLNRRRELFWTALPIAMTLALVLPAMALWRALF